MGAYRLRPFWGRNLTFKKSPIFQPAQKEPNLRNPAPYEKLIFFFARWKKLSFGTRCFKKGHFNTYNNFYIGCNSDAFERLSIVQRCSNPIGSQSLFFTLYVTVSTGGHARRAARDHLGPVARGPLTLGSGKQKNGPKCCFLKKFFNFYALSQLFSMQNRL